MAKNSILEEVHYEDKRAVRPAENRHHHCAAYPLNNPEDNQLCSELESAQAREPNVNRLTAREKCDAYRSDRLAIRLPE